MDTGLYHRFFEIEDHFWWSVGTRRIFFQVIHALDLQPGARVLDVGCGTGVTLKEFPAGWGTAFGSDTSSLALTYCRKRGLEKLARADAVGLPFRTDSLDLVMALDVIEHLDEDRACLSEMTRVCRSGGHILVHVPAFPVLWSEKDELNHHHRRYRREELVGVFESCDLNIIRLFYINVLLFPAALIGSFISRTFSRSQGRASSEALAAVDRLYQIPRPLNRFMIRWMDVERHLAMRYALPFGMSLVCLAQKPAGRGSHGV